MRIYLSFDYELFFGSHTGSVEKCLQEPTLLLQELAEKHKVPMIFFVDAGYLSRLNDHCHNAECKLALNLISIQLKQLILQGHQIALHVHPHWEDSHFENGKWIVNTRRYKLSDFSKDEAASIIAKYDQVLSHITGKKCNAYRAGGWCVQPFSHIREALRLNGISIDSSVYPHGYHDSPAHSYDFRTTPMKAEWKFENDCCVEDVLGNFKEISITPDKIGPAFYWDLYLKMKISPAHYKPMGDGVWLKDKGRIYKQFYSHTDHFACADGYFASRLKKNLMDCEKQKLSHMMVLSHPKSLAPCSFTYLDEFIAFSHQRGHKFSVLN